MPSYYGRQELFGFCPNRVEDVVRVSAKATKLRRRISVLKSRYPKLRNPQVWERHDRMVAELKKLESDGV